MDSKVTVFSKADDLFRNGLKMDKTPSLPRPLSPKSIDLETRDSCPRRETNPIEHVSETLDSTISPTLETRRFLPGTCQLQDPDGIQRAGESPSVKLFVINHNILSQHFSQCFPISNC